MRGARGAAATALGATAAAMPRPPMPAGMVRGRARGKMIGAGAGADAARLSTMKTTARPMSFILKSSCLAVSLGTDLIGLARWLYS